MTIVDMFSSSPYRGNFMENKQSKTFEILDTDKKKSGPLVEERYERMSTPRPTKRMRTDDNESDPSVWEAAAAGVLDSAELLKKNSSFGQSFRNLSDRMLELVLGMRTMTKATAETFDRMRLEMARLADDLIYNQILLASQRVERQTIVSSKFREDTGAASSKSGCRNHRGEISVS